MILLTSLLSAGGLAAKQAKLKMQTKNRVFTVRILQCIRNEIPKKSKKGITDANEGWLLLGRKRIHLAENANGLQHHAPDNLQAARAELVECVLGCVPVRKIVAVGEVDQIG